MRITIELVHCVHHWFDPEREPVASQGKHLLVLSGQHADISNIDDEHHFKQGRKCWVSGQPVVHVAGAYIGLMYNLIELRK